MSTGRRRAPSNMLGGEVRGLKAAPGSLNLPLHAGCPQQVELLRLPSALCSPVHPQDVPQQSGLAGKHILAQVARKTSAAGPGVAVRRFVLQVPVDRWGGELQARAVVKAD